MRGHRTLTRRKVSIPHWFDSTAASLRYSSRRRLRFNPTLVRFNEWAGFPSRSLLYSFNPTLVRFNEFACAPKVNSKQGFNPTLVRFNGCFALRPASPRPCFNPTLVRFNVTCPVLPSIVTLMFQSHTGSIQRFSGPDEL